MSRPRAEEPPIVLRYHSVGGSAWLRPELVVSAEHFAAHVRHLQRHHRVLPVEALLALAERGEPAPPGAVAITFDDGYRDNHDVAWPILRREGCPATVFVVVDSLETGAPPWPQRLYQLLSQARTPRLALPQRGDQLDHIAVDLDLSTVRARAAAYRVLKGIVARLDGKAREVLLDELAVVLGSDGAAVRPPEGWMLGWLEARQLAEAGITIGSHTMTHPSLARLAGDELAWELEESRRRLEAGLGRPITVLAYPFGKATDFREEVKAAARAAGYRAAYTTVHGTDGPGADPFALRRVKVRDEPAWRFAIRLLTLRRRRPLLEWILKDADAASPSPSRPSTRAPGLSIPDAG
jgi:peptidoglycan/xylan/chitin deacetylase (PgdA/CDA1 family)